jgi:hypothetical protein
MSVPANVFEASRMEALEARTERYLQEAERVRGAAERTEDPENRTVLLDIARQYETAATMVEELRRYR